MGVTKQIPRDEWNTYFERFTRRELQGEGNVHDAAVVELLSPTFGDQFETSLVRLLGLTYDPKGNTFELALENLDHLVFHPSELWVIEEEDGFISTLEIGRDDGSKELVHLRRSGPPAPRAEVRSRPGA